MAEEKTILTVDLYDNVLTEKTGDFTGKIRITGTTRTSDISNRIVKKRTEYRPETITNILDLSYDEMIEALAQGRCVVNKFGQWLLTINGSFDGKKSDFRSTENKITVMFTPSATLLKALENIYVNADVATVGPMIESLTDSTTNEKNLHITPNAPAIPAGHGPIKSKNFVVQKVGDVLRLKKLETFHFMMAGPEGAIVDEWACYHDNAGLRFTNQKAAL